MAVDHLAGKLWQLLEQGCLPSSRFAERDRARLRSLFDTRVLQEERSGAGKKVVVYDREAVERFFSNCFPSGIEGRPEELLPRSRAIADMRDSKKTSETIPPIALLRGFDGCELFVDGEVVPVVQWTNTAGVAALRIDDRQWRYGGTLAIVENLEFFWNIEKLNTGAQLALYAQGRLSGRILDWLASPGMLQSSILHCGDYDPVGLDEYLRIKIACPGRTKLCLPANLEVLLSRYGKKELLQSSSSVLDRLRKTEDQEVRRIVKLLDKYGVGLEQEALLLGQD
jgi:hypothetical protein